MSARRTVTSGHAHRQASCRRTRGRAAPTSAYSVSRAPDERGLWYVGTDFGCRDQPRRRRDLDAQRALPTKASLIQSVLAFPGGSVLAMDGGQSLARPAMIAASTWRIGHHGQLHSVCTFVNGGVGSASNKMDRAPDRPPWAFIFGRCISQHRRTAPERSGSTNSIRIRRHHSPFRQADRAGPFVRVSKDEPSAATHQAVGRHRLGRPVRHSARTPPRFARCCRRRNTTTG